MDGLIQVSWCFWYYTESHSLQVVVSNTDVLQVGPTSDMVEKGPPIPQDWVGKQRCSGLLG